MKLHRSVSALAVLLVAMTGCASRASVTTVSATRTPVSTVRLMAAELREEDDAPKVGKSQRSDATVVDDEAVKHDATSHRGLDRKRGGFSGYK